MHQECIVKACVQSYGLGLVKTCEIAIVAKAPQGPFTKGYYAQYRLTVLSHCFQRLYDVSVNPGKTSTSSASFPTYVAKLRAWAVPLQFGIHIETTA